VLEQAYSAKCSSWFRCLLHVAIVGNWGINNCLTPAIVTLQFIVIRNLKLQYLLRCWSFIRINLTHCWHIKFPFDLYRHLFFVVHIRWGYHPLPLIPTTPIIGQVRPVRPVHLILFIPFPTAFDILHLIFYCYWFPLWMAWVEATLF